MFISLLIFPLISLFHILIHALFKSLLFLLGGSLIHAQSNFQSIYKMKRNNSLIKILFIAGLIVPIFSFSKEGIIQSANTMYSSTFVYVIGFVGGMLTVIYSLKIYLYCFYLSYYGVLYSTFILPMLTITSILIDQCLDSCFPFCSSSSFFSLDFGSLFSFSFHNISNFSLVLFFVIPLNLGGQQLLKVLLKLMGGDGVPIGSFSVSVLNRVSLSTVDLREVNPKTKEYFSNILGEGDVPINLAL